MSTPILRPVTAEDTKPIQEMVALVVAEYGCTLDFEDEPHWQSPIDYFHPPKGAFWVLECEGRIVGTVAVKLHEDAGEVKCLYVHPDFRGQGWGQFLTRHVMEYARQHGKPKMILWTDTRFTKAHRMYEKMGYVRFGFRDLADNNNTKEYGYEQPLGVLSAST